MNFKNTIALLMVLLPLHLWAQLRISGTITDRQTRQPVDFASVYINGTTNGTLTDSLGYFHLENVELPCTVVVSHLSYVTQTKIVSDVPASNIDFLLETKVNKIEGVNVTDKNLKKENLKLFREKLLGNNAWGRHASIFNEDAIQFSREYTTEIVSASDKQKIKSIPKNVMDYQTYADGQYITYKIPTTLRANSTEPLKIELPLLGYTVYLDLIEFEWKPLTNTEQETCTIKGYSYFNEHTYHSKRDSTRINKNREKNFYNSAHHFCKSLYDNKLYENGYMMLEIPENIFFTKELNPGKYMDTEGKYAIITGLNKKRLIMRYYYDRNGRPVDLNKNNGINFIDSQIIFRRDTCVIGPGGTIPGNTIIFGSPVGDKKVGSMLPDNYTPENHTKN